MGTSSLSRADRKTFTGTNGNIVSATADRAVNPHRTRSKLASTKIAGTSDRLSARRRAQLARQLSSGQGHA
ncbi:hypothetical protein NDU88_000880 [Pleurodeles waltl]|uniref:Uncharacterized protein n=1 Tax=Pleurodeles waltl TaxID=8319 RepID=A0AAV7WKW8_PLEWA|nr:hypothetical protein NDU88_000880 [Pleurodeles waltl]